MKAVLELLIQAAKAGELDKPLLATSERKRKEEEAPAKPETPRTGAQARTGRGH